MNILGCKWCSNITLAFYKRRWGNGRVRGIGFLELWFVPHDGGYKGVAALWRSECRRARPALLIREEARARREMYLLFQSIFLSLFSMCVTALLLSERRCFAKWNATCYFTLCMQRFWGQRKYRDFCTYIKTLMKLFWRPSWITYVLVTRDFHGLNIIWKNIVFYHL